VLSAPVVAVVLLAATLHAGWNVVVRAGSDRRRESALLLGGGAAIAIVVLPFLPGLPAAAWPYVITSSLLNGLYFILVAEAYAHGGVALAYPLMRGVAPMMTLLAAWLLLGEALPAAVWIGVATICSGVVLLARRRGDADETTSVKFALANAVVIAAYTLNDAVGVRISHAPLAYTLWLFPLSAIPTLLWLRRKTPLRWPGLAEAARGLGGAGASIGAYALVLWAITRAPVAPVAALRETSILIGVLLARVFLGERPGRRGWGGAVAIAAGAVMLRLAPG
jgi:drug/metabolite transporter (DMT)-like permease